jgi:hypothetical protein
MRSGGKDALFGQFAWTVWVGDVTTWKLPVLGFRARMGDVNRLAGPGKIRDLRVKPGLGSRQ